MKAWQIVLSVAFLLNLFSLGNATILRVALDGSQPYNIIQEAINASAHGDTVLVYPGRYYENIRFYGKNITLASLELTTGNLDYKYSTIIDGSNSQEVIKIVDYEDNVTIRGITITNGSGSYVPEYDTSVGGGINIARMSGSRNASLVNCIVRGNYAEIGGGIWAGTCNLFLSGVSILRNEAVTGGGFYYSGNNNQTFQVTFDPTNRCSIYNNKAGRGTDIFVSEISNIHVIVDTFAVHTPSVFYAGCYSDVPNMNYPYTFNILHNAHTEINHDLYVSPYGNDSNAGVSETSPLRTIYQAVYNIASDSENPKTIYIDSGYYSQLTNNQFFPLSMKSHTRLVGKGKESTVINFEGDDRVCIIPALSQNVEISGLSFMEAKKGFYVTHSSGIKLDNVVFSNIGNSVAVKGYDGYRCSNQELIDCTYIDISSPQEATGISIGMGSGDIKLINTEISDCNSGTWMPTLHISTINDADVVIDGCSFHDNMSSAPDVWNSIMQIGPFSYNQSQRLGVKISNSAFYNNHQSNPSFMGIVTALNDTTFVRNCTFAGNSGGSSALTVKGNAVFENNIFWNPGLPKEITAYYSSTEGISGRLEFDNNCIRNGLSGIYNMSPLNEIVWHDNNLTLDPQFVGSGSHPYRLSAASPLIDIGLQPAFFEPSYDAGGNERVWDGDGDGSAVIDLGAYEYQPIVSPYNLSAELWNQQILLGWQMPETNRSLSGFRIYRNNQAYADIPDPGCRLFRDYSPVNDTLSYYVVALYGEVESEPTNSVTVIVSGVANSDETMVPVISRVSVSPNPFRDLAVISYELGKASEVELKLYNLKGQLVRILQQGSQSKGFQTLAWEGCDDSGRPVASGIYLLQLSIGGKAQKAIKLVKW